MKWTTHFYVINFILGKIVSNNINKGEDKTNIEELSIYFSTKNRKGLIDE
jgi:hypothetical protein